MASMNSVSEIASFDHQSDVCFIQDGIAECLCQSTIHGHAYMKNHHQHKKLETEPVLVIPEASNGVPTITLFPNDVRVIPKYSPSLRRRILQCCQKISGFYLKDKDDSRVRIYLNVYVWL